MSATATASMFPLTKNMQENMQDKGFPVIFPSVQRIGSCRLSTTIDSRAEDSGAGCQRHPTRRAENGRGAESFLSKGKCWKSMEVWMDRTDQGEGDGRRKRHPSSRLEAIARKAIHYSSESIESSDF